jgi:hypothetical protein
MYSRVNTAASILCVLLTAACASAPAAPREPVAPLAFSFNVPHVAAPASADVVLLLIAPEWARDGSNAGSQAALRGFSDALKNEFVKVLVARGFTTKGDVYASRDELVYGDKVTSDLIIIPQMDVRFRFTHLEAGGVPIPVIGYFAVDGSAVVEGRIVLNAYESVTNERVWTKPITLEPVNVSWTGEAQLRDITLKDQRAQWPALALNDPGFQRVMNPQINAMFTRVMQTAWNHMDPAEFAVLKGQADELKRKANAVIR